MTEIIPESCSLADLPSQTPETPPGILPINDHELHRADHIALAMARFFSAGISIPTQWIEELEILNDSIISRKK